MTAESRSPNDEHFDIAIVGAGPAGLSAALILGRMRRTVLVLDTEAPVSYTHLTLPTNAVCRSRWSPYH